MNPYFIIGAIIVVVAIVLYVGWRLVNMATEFDKIFGEGGEQ